MKTSSSLPFPPLLHLFPHKKKSPISSLLSHLISSPPPPPQPCPAVVREMTVQVPRSAPRGRCHCDLFRHRGTKGGGGAEGENLNSSGRVKWLPVYKVTSDLAVNCCGQVLGWSVKSLLCSALLAALLCFEIITPVVTITQDFFFLPHAEKSVPCFFLAL